jgi:hypothetical protein
MLKGIWVQKLKNEIWWQWWREFVRTNKTTKLCKGSWIIHITYRTQEILKEIWKMTQEWMRFYQYITDSIHMLSLRILIKVITMIHSQESIIMIAWTKDHFSSKINHKIAQLIKGLLVKVIICIMSILKRKSVGKLLKRYKDSNRNKREIDLK